MRYEAPRVGRVLLTSMVLQYASPRTEGSMAERSKGFTARRRPPSYPRRTPRCAAEGRHRETWTSRSPNYRRRVSPARGMSRSSAAGKANWLRDPKETFPGCKALKNHETGKESRLRAGSRSALGAPPPRSPARPGPPPAEASAKPLPGHDEETRRRYGASGRPLVPGPARVKAACYFFCDFT